MDNFTIFNLQTLAGFLMVFLGLRWFILPRVSKLPIREALIPFVFLHGIRYLGMMFMVDNQIYDEFPKDLAFTIGIWDYSVAILALITTYALKVNWKYAVPLVWIFNLWGFADLMTALPQASAQEFYNYDIGGIWWMSVIVGPITIISHIYIFIRLFKNLKKN